MVVRRMLRARDDRWLDRGVAALGLFVALAMFPLRFFVSHVFAKTLPVVLGVACVLYLLADRYDGRRTRLPALPATAMRALPPVVVLLSVVLVWTAAFQGARTVVFYDLATVAGALVLAQVLLADESEFHPGVVLLQAFTLAGTLRYAAYVTTPSYIGIDVWTHILNYTRRVLSAHSLGAISSTKYVAAPLYHLYVAVLVDATGASFEHVLYGALGLAMVLSALLVYPLARQFVGPRWATFATVAYVFSDEAIKWSLHLIPTSLAAAFFLAAFFLLVRTIHANGGRDVLALAFFLVAIALTHQVSAFVTFVVLGTAVAVQFLLYFDFPYDVSPSNVLGILVFDAGVVMFVWSVTPFHGDSFVTGMLLVLQERLRKSLGFGKIQGQISPSSNSVPLPEAVRTVTLFDQFVNYIDVLGFLLLLTLGTIGFLYILRRRVATHSLLLLFVASVVMSVFALGLPLFGVSTFLPGRWYVFLYVPLAVAGAVGVGHLARELPGGIAAACFVVLIVAVPVGMFTASDATYDSPAYPSNQPRYGYTQAEVAAERTISRQTPSDLVFSDYPYTQLFERGTVHQPAAPVVAVPGRRPEHDYIVYRRYHTVGAPYFAGKNRSVTYIAQVPRSYVCGPDRSVVYAAGEVRLCVDSFDR